jgi:hypothetical protein
MRAISAAEWNDILTRAGVNEVCWSIITGRCGSTLLASLTAASRFGNGGEPLNDLAEGRVREPVEEFVERTVRQRAINGRLYLQINWPRYEKIKEVVPMFQSEAPPSLIFRRNIFAQALSFWNAHTTGVWHNHAGVLNEQRPVQPGLDPAGFVQRIARQEIAMVRRFPTAQIFYYEGIVSSPAETLLAFGLYHGATITPEKISAATSSERLMQKIARPGYVEQYVELLSQYPKEVVSRRIVEGFSMGANKSLIDMPAMSA